MRSAQPDSIQTARGQLLILMHRSEMETYWSLRMYQFSGSLGSCNYYRNLRKKNLQRYCLRKTKSTIKHSLDSFILRNLYLTQTKIPFPFKIRHNSQNRDGRNTYTFPKCMSYKKATKSYLKYDEGQLLLRSMADTAIPHFLCEWNFWC